MSTLLIKIFVKDYKNTSDEKVRNRYGILSGAVGIVLNIILSTFKIIFGRITGSISITADGFNNIFDAGSSIISLAGFKISGKPADKDHPFGHGRIEYVSALVLAFLILVMGVELVKTSVSKFSDRSPVLFNYAAVIVIVLSILGKIWLAYFNSKVGKRINSLAVDAVVKDSISDILSTTATLIALIVSNYTSFPIDAVMGIAVALFIAYSGIGILKDTLGPILGEPPEAQIVNDMVSKISSFEGVLGVHDLIVHTYGASKIFASIHVEVAADVDVLISHDMIDNIEKDVHDSMGIELTVHLDPIDTNDERVSAYKAVVTDIAAKINSELTIHDFRIVDGQTHTNLIFDTVKPYSVKLSNEELKDEFSKRIRQELPKCFAVINIDNNYV